MSRVTTCDTCGTHRWENEPDCPVCYGRVKMALEMSISRWEEIKMIAKHLEEKAKEEGTLTKLLDETFEEFKEDRERAIEAMYQIYINRMEEVDF